VFGALDRRQERKIKLYVYVLIKTFILGNTEHVVARTCGSENVGFKRS
jgi:hypothetical protein